MYIVTSIFTTNEPKASVSWTAIAGEGYTPAIYKAGITTTTEQASIDAILSIFHKTTIANRGVDVVVHPHSLHKVAGNKEIKAIAADRRLTLNFVSDPAQASGDLKAAFNGWVCL